jgi:hypothetical protein
MVSPMRQMPELPPDVMLVARFASKPLEPVIGKLKRGALDTTGRIVRQALKHICSTLIGVDKDELHRSENADW